MSQPDLPEPSTPANTTASVQVSNTLLLYGTLGCHLCEQAEWLLQPLRQTAWQLQVIDITEQTDSDALVERYGLRLPVLRFGTAELDWPFDLVQVERWLATQQARGSP